MNSVPGGTQYSVKTTPPSHIQTTCGTLLGSGFENYSQEFIACVILKMPKLDGHEADQWVPFTQGGYKRARHELRALHDIKTIIMEDETKIISNMAKIGFLVLKGGTYHVTDRFVQAAMQRFPSQN